MDSRRGLPALFPDHLLHDGDRQIELIARDAADQHLCLLDRGDRASCSQDAADELQTDAGAGHRSGWRIFNIHDLPILFLM